VLCDQASVPGKKRRWLDHERLPASTGHSRAERGQQGSVGIIEGRLPTWRRRTES